MEAVLTAEAPVKAVLRAVRFCSDARYAWMGETIPPIPKPLAQTWTEQSRRDWTLLHLKTRIYNDFYCAGAPRPATAALVPYQGRAMTPFMKRLSAANQGRGHDSPGWTAAARAGEALVVGKGGLRLWVRPGRDLGEPALDGRVSLRFPKEFLNISPGFYVALGDRNVEATPEDVLLRFYFNLTPEGAVQFLEDATSSLNQAGVAFRIKTVNDPKRFDRCDTVVLYVSRADYPAVSTVIAKAHLRFADALKGPAPPFTKALAPGIGLAEDPGGGESFGAHRSRALAEGLIEAQARGLTSLTGRLEVVRERFEVRNIRFDRPYLTVSRTDDYDVTLTPPARRPHRPASPVTPLAAAAEIGARLVRDAVWYGQACNWVGVEPEGAAAGAWSSRKVYAALGTNLYAGSSGVAVFLAELSLATGEAAARQCALGALRQALDRIDREANFGLYTGSLGVSWAAVRVGLRLGEAEFAERGRALVAQAKPAPGLRDDDEADLLSGKAGAIVALLALGELLDEAAFTDRARALGDALLRTAEVDAAAMSWRSPVQRRGRNLTGFAHGAAGVGFALARLFAGTGVAAYGEAAKRAFAYERRWFDAKAGNWRDFRDADPRRGRARSRRPLFATAWCHGAPGVALSRLEGFAALGDTACRAEALTALRTTAEHTRASLAAGGRGGCLCHGLAGNADILLCGARVLDGDFAEGDDLARAAAEALLAAPAGEDEPPGLMLGLAGRGYALLRQHDPAIPSVLALGAR